MEGIPILQITDWLRDLHLSSWTSAAGLRTGVQPGLRRPSALLPFLVRLKVVQGPYSLSSLQIWLNQQIWPMTGWISELIL